MCCALYSWLKWFGDMSCKANQKFAQIMLQFAINTFDVFYLLHLLRTKSFFVFAGHLPTKKCKYFSFLHERPFMRATGQTLGTLSVHKIWYLLLPLIQLTSPSLLWKTQKIFRFAGNKEVKLAELAVIQNQWNYISDWRSCSYLNFTLSIFP